MKNLSIFSAVLLLFTGLQGCKITAADPDLATTMVGTYTGKETASGSSTSYAASVVVKKTSAKGITLTLSNVAKNTLEAQMDNMAVTSATTFTGVYDRPT